MSFSFFLLPFAAAAVSAWAFKNASVSALAFLFSGAVALLFSAFSFSEWAVQATGALAAMLFAFYLWAAHRKRFSVLVPYSFLTLLILLFLALAVQASSHPPTWILLLFVGAVSALLFFLSHTLMLELGFWLKFRLAWFSLVVGIVMAEFYWAASQLPLDIVNIDFLLGIVYYTLWDIAHRYLSLRFTKRALAGALAFLCAGVGIVLVSVQWLPH